MPLWARPAAAAGASDTARQARFLRADSAGGERGPGRPSRAWLAARRGLARSPTLATSALGCGLGRWSQGRWCGEPSAGLRRSPGATLCAHTQVSAALSHRLLGAGPDLSLQGSRLGRGGRGVFSRVIARSLEAKPRRELRREACAGLAALPAARRVQSPPASRVSLDSLSFANYPPPPSLLRRLHFRRETPCRLRGAWHVGARSWGARRSSLPGCRRLLPQIRARGRREPPSRCPSAGLPGSPRSESLARLGKE